MGLTGGAAPLLAFLREYRKASETFVSKGNRFPLIVVVDNDGASKDIFSFIKKITGSHKMIDGSEPYYRLMPMVFVVPIPKPPSSTTAAIESLFDSSLLSTIHKGKIFHGSDKGFDEDKHYTKSVFAKEVVEPHFDKINFDGFKPLLDAISEVVGLSSP
ncbi:hypothetical protein GCM10023089_18760 [Quisquiliibacterium transsilvanicum]